MYPGCVVQPTVQAKSTCTEGCTAHCTESCTTRRLTLVGVRGRSATSAVGAVVALTGQTTVRTEIVTADLQLIAVTPPAEVAAQLLVVQAAYGDASSRCFTPGTVTEASVSLRASGERGLSVPQASQPEFRDLRRWFTSQLDPFPLRRPLGRRLHQPSPK